VPNFAVLVLSCDKYSDLWDGFFSLFFRNFNYDAKLYLANNFKKYQYKDKSIEIINCGEDKNWSNHLISALKHLNEDFIFIILEDLYIVECIKKEEIFKVIEFSIAENIQHLKYSAFPVGDLGFKKGYKKYSPGMPYSVSVCGIWNKNYLLSLLLDGESAWDFEINGSYRSKFSNERFYCPIKPLIDYINMVEKGRWVLENVEKAKKLGIEIDLGRRLIKGRFAYSVVNYYFNLVVWLIPYNYRIKFVGIIKKLLASY